MTAIPPRGEFALIDTLLKPLAGHPAARGLDDDAAVLGLPPGQELVLTKDALVEGVHFLPDDPPGAIAQKLMRVNLSDLAAMGAVPLGYLLALMRPKRLDDTWLEAFTRGLAEDQRTYGVHALGGDTTRTDGPLCLSLTALGLVPAGRALPRGGAAAGDVLYVSGHLGLAALGLRLLTGALDIEDPALRATLIARYRLPQPRTVLGPRLLGLASACLDISDGLLADLGHIMTASKLGARLDLTALPLAPGTAALPGALDAALSGGDDYELLFTLPATHAPHIAALAGELDLPLSAIGTMTAAPGLVLLDADGREVAPPAQHGWRHF